MENMKTEALKYAEMGFAVFPVRKNKTPCTKQGCKDAEMDAKKINEWWSKWNKANIGIATGSISGGLVVIDIDEDEDRGIYGKDSLREWEKVNGKLPETWTVITGRGGYHFYYHSTQKFKNATGLYDGIDIRGEGGYVIAPPSVHMNGNNYEWEISPDDMPIAEVDETVLKFITGGKESIEEAKARFELPDTIKNGYRNDTLYKYGCSMQAKGFPDDRIEEELQIANCRCEEPLPDHEIQTILESVKKLEKGTAHVPIDENGSVAKGWRKPILAFDDQGKIYQTTNNMVEAIQFDGSLYGKIRKNTIAYAPYVFGTLPWETGTNNIREWNNDDDANLRNYIEKEYKLKPGEKMMDALTIVAKRNEYNPITDFLEQRHLQWDQESHIADLLPKYLGVEKNEYSIEVMKLFMLGAISRAYYPGCKFDYVPIIYGSQGCGKSTFCKRLAMNSEWFDDNFNTIEGDKASEKLRGLWIAELAELLATKKAKEIESIKSFLTSTIDNYRPPYARRTEQRKRVCVFIGTTNSNHFLTDRTGNRRFLPIIANEKKVQVSITNSDNDNEILIDINNAWGEAMELFLQANKKPKLVLPKSLDPIVKRMQSKFAEDDYRVGKIQDYLDTIEKDRVCVPELWEKALGNFSKMERFEVTALHEIMEFQIDGWVLLEKRQRMPGYGLQKCYQRKSGMFAERYTKNQEEMKKAAEETETEEFIDDPDDLPFD